MDYSVQIKFCMHMILYKHKNKYSCYLYCTVFCVVNLVFPAAFEKGRLTIDKKGTSCVLGKYLGQIKWVFICVTGIICLSGLSLFWCSDSFTMLTVTVGVSNVSSEQRTRVQMSPEAQNDIWMHGYDFYQINLYVFNKFHIFYKLQWLLRSLQWKLGRDQKYSLSGNCKRNVNYGTCITYPDLEQCQSRFSLFKFLINVSKFLISWIKSLFFSKQR